MHMSKYVGNLFLRVDDIKASGPVRLKIVERLSCNATNGRAFARVYGFDSEDWVGKEVELVVGEIEYQGKPQEAILVKTISPPIKSKAPPKPDDLDDSIPF